MIDKKDVLKSAELARIAISDAEAVAYETQLQQVLKNFDAIREIPTDKVEPLYSTALEPPCLREDVVDAFDKIDEALENAPEVQGQLFKVPPVV